MTTQQTDDGDQSNVTPPVTATASPTGRRSLLGPFSFAYIACFCLVSYGIYEGGIWEIVAFTRVLDVLIDSGLVAYTDQQMGLIKGLPDLDLYLVSQEPVHWEVLGFVALLYFAFNLLKIVQFHGIARFYGLTGSFGSHVRAYLYGQGLHRILPFSGGDVAVVSALVGQGEDSRKASSVVHVHDLFIWFEIAAFAVVAVVWKGWQDTFLQLLWPMIFLGLLFYITRGQRHAQNAPSTWENFRQVFQSFSSRPKVLMGLCLLSIMCFLMKDLAPYFVSQGLSSNELILHVPFWAIHGAILGGYLASRISITPHGIGQYEFGFGMALAMAGTGFAVSMTILIIDGLIRHGVLLLLFAIMRVWHGVETDTRQVLDRFANDLAIES